MSGLPGWASWKWAQNYLPADVHIAGDEFPEILDSFRRTRFADGSSGTNIVLGLGLLLRDCWRAVEVEPEGEGYPDFLVNSALGVERAEQVVSTIKEILSQLPSPQPVTEEQDKVVAKPGGSEEAAEEKGNKGTNATDPSPEPAPATKKRTRKPSKKILGEP